MPPTPIDLSLHSLLPTTSNLAPDLTALARSLISQSKIKAAHLKPDEEIARIYACCHIAAERLRNSHGYELDKARPPVAPRVYNKLKGFLEGVLGVPGTPGGRDGRSGDENAGSAGGKRKTPQSAPTSMRKKWVEARKSAGSNRRRVVAEKERVDAGLEVPDYAMPMIRHLCKACGASKAAPHVYTGLSVVLKEYGKPGSKEEDASTPTSGRKRKRGAVELDERLISDNDVPGVVLVLFMAVVRMMYGAEQLSGGRHLEAARRYAMDDNNSGLPASANQDNYFTDALSRFNLGNPDGAGRWTEMEWFDNVPEAAEPENAIEADEEDDTRQNAIPVRNRPAKTPLRRKEKHAKLDDGGSEMLGRAGLLPGLGTMFQPAVDWLSDERVAEFARWKREVEKEISALVAAA